MSHIESIHSIAARRWKVAITLSVLMLAIYLGFILLVAFGKPWLSPRLSVGARHPTRRGHVWALLFCGVQASAACYSRPYASA